MCDTCDRHRAIVIKDEPEAFLKRLKRMHRFVNGRATMADIYGPAKHNSTRLTAKGKALLEQLRKDGEL